MTQLRTYISKHSRPLYQGVASSWFAGNDDGQTLAEYALILALIAVAVVVAVGVLQGNITNIFNSVSSNL